MNAISRVVQSPSFPAIVGSGWGISVQIPAFRSAGWEIVALIGRDASKTAKLAAEHNVPFSTSNLAEALAREDVEVVSVVTPPRTHHDYALQVLAAGKHLLAEKPFAWSAGEAEEMVAAHRAACAKYKRPIIAMVDHELRFHASVLAAKEFILSGQFGRISHANLAFFGSMPPVVQEYWNWWNDASQFGGALGAVGSHYIDLVSFLTSSEVQLNTVRCSLQTTVKEKKDPDNPEKLKAVTSDDFAEYTFRLKSDPESRYPSFRGSKATLQEFSCTTQLHAGSFGYYRNEVLLISDRGSFVIDMRTMQAIFTPADAAHPKGIPGKEMKWESDAPQHLNQPPKVISPFSMGTVLLARRLESALEEVKLHSGKATACSSSQSPATELTQLPPSLLKVAASFEDGLYCQRVLDAARKAAEAHPNSTKFVDRGGCN